MIALLLPYPGRTEVTAGCGFDLGNVRVRRQGLEPRTRGLRVCCSRILFSYSTSEFNATCCRDTRNAPRRHTVCWRLISGSTGTSEQTWSKHGTRMV